MKPQLKKNLDIIQKHRDILLKRHHVRRIGIFGSVARGDATDKSDIDLLVDFDESISLFDLVDLEDYLQKLLRRNVDVVPRGALKPLLRKNILRDVRYV